MPFNCTFIPVIWQNPTDKIGRPYEDGMPDIEKMIEGYEKVNQHIIYQIYGYSPIYGDNSLLYIGITGNANKRFDQHLTARFLRGTNIYMRIGTLGEISKSNHNSNNSVSQEKDKNYLEIAESILICLHKPSMNKEYVDDIFGEAKTDAISNNIYYHVLNHGNRGALMLECSSIWWIDPNKFN